jgi:FlaA1/EpsC-like NDP-sugar epimerase
VIVIDWLLTLAAVGGLRMGVRLIGDARERAQKGNGGTPPKRVLVAGAGEAGSLVVREMQRNPQLGLLPVGFLDDASAKRGAWMHGVRVLGPLSALAEVVRTHHVDEVVIAMPAMSGSVVRAVAETCRHAGVKSRTIPGVFELLDGQVSVSRLRNVEIADLLRRSQVLGSPEAASYVAGRVVLVTGAGGSIGSELCRQVALGGPSCLVLLGHGENSIFEAMLRLRASPTAVFRGVIADVRIERGCG